MMVKLIRGKVEAKGKVENIAMRVETWTFEWVLFHGIVDIFLRWSAIKNC